MIIQNIEKVKRLAYFIEWKYVKYALNSYLFDRAGEFIVVLYRYKTLRKRQLLRSVMPILT